MTVDTIVDRDDLRTVLLSYTRHVLNDQGDLLRLPFPEQMAFLACLRSADWTYTDLLTGIMQSDLQEEDLIPQCLTSCEQ